MANKSYLPAPHRLLSGYSALTSPRGSLGSAANASPPPEFSYDVFPRDSPRNSSVRDSIVKYSRTPSSTGSSAMSMAYSSVQDFPYGLSGVQMPTYNFGSELYNYVSNGFPRKSRMCTFCNKVFTRSTTRRYHEKRCPLLRASSSLAKNEENNSTSASLNALKEQQLQQRQKEARGGGGGGGGGGGHHNSIPTSPLPRTLSSSITNTMSSQAGSLPQASPPLPSLHPAYPTSFPKSPALGSAPTRSGAYGYPHPYSSHFYNSISAAALASLDQNGLKQDSDSAWPPSGSPPSAKKLPDPLAAPSKPGSGLAAGPLSLAKAFNSEAVVDLTARYCADFTLRTRPPVFPAPSLRAPPHSPPSPERGEGEGGRHEEAREGRGRDSPAELLAVTSHPPRARTWSNPHREDKMAAYGAVSSSSLEEERERRRSSSSPLSDAWHDKEALEPRPFMKVEPLDEEDEEELEDEDDEDEVEEDEEQFKTDSLASEGADDEVTSLNYKGTPYTPLVCQFCKKVFSDVVTRKAHEELHAQKKLFACCLCSHSFHCAYSLRIHTLRHHREGSYKCKYCFLDHASAATLRTHLIEEHSLPKTEFQSLKYVSLLATPAPSLQDSLLNNAVSDGEQDEYSSTAFANRRRGETSARGQYNYADETTKALLSPTAMDGMRGKEEKAGAEEAMETCKICNKSFTKSYIRLHERTHADQKPYECPICNKRFGYKNNMKSHMKLHQGLKPYQCQICGARFTRGSTLRRHGRRHNISHGAMLDYVLYDQRSGRAAGMGAKAGLVPASAPGVKSHFVLPSQSAAPAGQPSESQASPGGKHAAFASMPGLIHAANGMDTDRFNAAAKQRSPTRISPPHQPGGSPRGSGGANPFSSHSSISNPMVGGLAAVAAANLFAYPTAAAAPHLYQFYASAANPLMGYPPYPTAQGVHGVQSDALNLSLGKRKSPEAEVAHSLCKRKSPKADASPEQRDFKPPRTEELAAFRGSPTPSPEHHAAQNFKLNQTVKAELKSEEAYEALNTDTVLASSPSSKKQEPQLKLNFKSEPVEENAFTKDRHGSGSRSPEELKISTEDFGAQVNICCPSPRVQSSSGSTRSVANSPVGSSSGPDGHLHAQASPSGLSQASSPVNSAPSPTAPHEGGQDLLLSLLSSGRLFRCSYCDIYFSEYAMYRLHQKYHQCDVTRPFLCAVCGEDCKDKTYFTVHLSEHLGLGPKTCLP